VPLELDTSRRPTLFMRRFVLEGEADDGTRVYGSMEIMAPPRLDRDHHTPVTDDLQKQRIMAAMQILDKQQVSEEDMMRLDERGLLPRATPPGPAATASGGTQQPPTPPAAPTSSVGIAYHGPNKLVSPAAH
jgi:hypothetical protein